MLKDDASVDVRATGFWSFRHHHSFFDARVFNPFASDNPLTDVWLLVDYDSDYWLTGLQNRSDTANGVQGLLKDII